MRWVAVRAGKIVTYCDKNARGVMAAYWLREMGLDVSVLRGGLTAWCEAGEALEKPSEAASGESPAGAGEVLLLEQARSQAAPYSSGEASARRFGAILDVDLSSSYERAICRFSLGVQRPAGRAGARTGREQKSAGDVRLRGRAKIRPERTRTPKARIRRAGYLEGGKKAWREAGYSLDTGREGLDELPKDVQLKPYDIGRSAMEGYLTWEENLGKKYARK